MANAAVVKQPRKPPTFLERTEAVLSKLPLHELHQVIGIQNELLQHLSKFGALADQSNKLLCRCLTRFLSGLASKMPEVSGRTKNSLPKYKVQTLVIRCGLSDLFCFMQKSA